MSGSSFWGAISFLYVFGDPCFLQYWTRLLLAYIVLLYIKEKTPHFWYIQNLRESVQNENVEFFLKIINNFKTMTWNIKPSAEPF